jgi:D-alanyl-D-alanine carboxypeptidase
MSQREAAHRRARWIPTNLLLGLAVVIAAVAPELGNAGLTSGSWIASSFPSAASTSLAERPNLDVRGDGPGAPGNAANGVPDGETLLRPEGAGGLGEADGLLPDRVTAFDDRYPGITNLNPDLLRALRRAATRAAKSGLDVFVTSGWRSLRFQEALFQQAISEYGSAATAARWVATPGTSAHESGNAVDIGPSAAAAWLAMHGAVYGLCQIYRNEPWHFELRPAAIDRGCPRMYANPTQDPRLQSGK